MKRLGRWTETHARLAGGLVLCVALATRVFAVVSSPATPEGDSRLYDSLARSLLAGKGYSWEDGTPTAFVPPGYPLFLATLYGTFRADATVAYLAQALLGTLSVYLLMFLARICLTRFHGLLAGLLAAVYPALLWLPRRLLSENLALPLALGAVCAAGLMLQRASHGWALAMGLLLGIGVLVRGAGIFLAAALLLGLFWLSLKRDMTVLRASTLAAAALGGCIVTSAPWLARNAGVVGAPVLSTQSGLALYSSYWPPTKNGRRLWGNNSTAEDPEVARALAAPSELAASRLLAATATSRLAERPDYVLRLAPEKLEALVVPLDWEIVPPAPGRSRSVSILYMVLLLPAAIGAWRLVRAPPPHVWLLWVMPVAVLVQTICFYGSPRFRVMAEPSLIVFAAAGLLHRRRRALVGIDPSQD